VAVVRPPKTGALEHRPEKGNAAFEKAGAKSKSESIWLNEGRWRIERVTVSGPQLPFTNQGRSAPPLLKFDQAKNFFYVIALFDRGIEIIETQYLDKIFSFSIFLSSGQFYMVIFRFVFINILTCEYVYNNSNADCQPLNCLWTQEKHSR
jgi:hypothetical protein